MLVILRIEYIILIVISEKSLGFSNLSRCSLQPRHESFHPLSIADHQVAIIAAKAGNLKLMMKINHEDKTC